MLCEFAERDLLPTMQSHAGTRDLRDFSMWGLYAPNLDKEIRVHACMPTAVHVHNMELLSIAIDTGIYIYRYM